MYDTGKMCRAKFIKGCTWNVNFVVSETSREHNRIAGGLVELVVPIENRVRICVCFIFFRGGVSNICCFTSGLCMY